MRSSWLARGSLALGGLSMLAPADAAAEGLAARAESPTSHASLPSSVVMARTPRAADGYLRWFGGVFVGRGLRFNNPYRLRSVLGDDAESLSLGATYLDLHVARTFGDPHGLEHGVALHLSIATDGVRQEVITPSYLVSHRIGPRFFAFGRAGIPVVLEPDASFGLEAGLGAAYMLSASVGVGGELDFSLFYGAATIEKPLTVIPMLSLAFGAIFVWETLP